METLKPYGFIYVTTNTINNVKYIGQKTFDNYGNGRWKIYLGSGTYFKNALKKYGKENFTRETIATANSKEELNQLEIKFIKEYNAVKSKNYYNASFGGDVVMKNIHHSKETRDKMKKSHTGLKLTDEVKQKIRKIHKGKIVSKETRYKLSLARKEKYSGENHPHFGGKNSTETRHRISESNKGRKSWNEGLHYTEESRKKMSDSAKSKLTDIQLLEIREKYDTGNYSCVTLAKEYPVSQGTIFNIISYKHAYAKGN